MGYVKKIMFDKKRILTFLTSFSVQAVICCMMVVIVAIAATNYIPSRQADGNSAITITPSTKSEGNDAEVVTPNVTKEEDTNKEPIEDYVPDFVDSDEFIDLESSFDFSKQYDYSKYVLSPANGSCTVSDGTYTATSASSIYANFGNDTAFPYGTISADVMNNGGDTGIIFGLSADHSSFWEGNGITYYFAFINADGILFLGSTQNGQWNTLLYSKIPGFTTTTVYNLKVVYRIDKLVVCLNDVPMLTYRTTKPFTGVNWGIRTGAFGATISNIEISSKATLN